MRQLEAYLRGSLNNATALEEPLYETNRGALLAGGELFEAADDLVDDEVRG